MVVVISFCDTVSFVSSHWAAIFGIWSGKHIESGAPIHLKFFIIQEFNDDGKVISLNEWFDPSSIGDQIDAFLSKQTK